MTASEARELMWSIGGDIVPLLGLLAVILTGLAVIGEMRR